MANEETLPEALTAIFPTTRPVNINTQPSNQRCKWWFGWRCPACWRRVQRFQLTRLIDAAMYYFFNTCVWRLTSCGGRKRPLTISDLTLIDAASGRNMTAAPLLTLDLRTATVRRKRPSANVRPGVISTPVSSNGLTDGKCSAPCWSRYGW